MMQKTFFTMLLLSALAIGYSLHLVFQVVPNERIMGAVQRIFYFHVGAAFAAYVAIAALFFGSLTFLSTRKPRFDALVEASGEIAFLFISINLFTGMLWGHYAWGTVFTLEPRLITSLVLWLLLLSMVVLRGFGDRSRIAAHSAVLGLICSVMVPVVIYSIRLLNQQHQLHPQVVGRGGLEHPDMFFAFWFVSAALVLFQALLLWLRYRIAVVERGI